jgi:hypothetical protein
MADLRCTAYWYASRHGLPCDTGSLLALGLAAARHARWLGIPPWYVPEGPLRVHTWPLEVFAYVTRPAQAPPPPQQPQFYPPGSWVAVMHRPG